MLFLSRNDDALQSESFLQELKGVWHIPSFHYSITSPTWWFQAAMWSSIFVKYRLFTLHQKLCAHETTTNRKHTKKLLYTPPSKLQRKKPFKKNPFSVSFCHQKKGLLKDLSFPHQTELLFKQRAHGMLVHKAGKERGWWWRSMVGLWLGMGVWQPRKIVCSWPPVYWKTCLLPFWQ